MQRQKRSRRMRATLMCIWDASPEAVHGEGSRAQQHQDGAGVCGRASTTLQPLRPLRDASAFFAVVASAGCRLPGTTWNVGRYASERPLPSRHALNSRWVLLRRRGRGLSAFPPPAQAHTLGPTIEDTMHIRPRPSLPHPCHSGDNHSPAATPSRNPAAACGALHPTTGVPSRPLGRHPKPRQGLAQARTRATACAVNQCSS